MRLNDVKIIGSLLLRDLLVFRLHIKGRFIDACLWSSVNLFVAQYLLPQFGVHADFGMFVLIGNIAAWGMLEVGTNVSIFISDLLGLQSITYYLTLPVSSNLVFIRIALADGMKSFFSTLPLLPIGKIILHKHFDLGSLCYGKLFLMYIVAHIFFGFFSLYLSSRTPDLTYLTTVKQRIIFPMWFLGCYQFTWHMLHTQYPVIAYINLLNPIVYIMEGLRHATVHTYDLLPYSLCVGMVLLFSALFGYCGVTNLKKRLDCI